MSDDVFRLNYDDTLVISLIDIEKDQIAQLISYLKRYDITDLGTVLNLIIWGEGRNIEVEVEVKRSWKPRSWGLELLVNLYRTSQRVRDIIPPKAVS